MIRSMTGFGSATFDNGMYKILFKDGYKTRESTNFEKSKYHFTDKIFSFNQGICIVQNNLNQFII